MQAVRDASVAAAKKLNDFGVEISMRKDIFDNVVAFRDRDPAMAGLTDEQRRFVEKEIVMGKRNGERVFRHSKIFFAARDTGTAVRSPFKPESN